MMPRTLNYLVATIVLIFYVPTSTIAQDVEEEQVLILNEKLGSTITKQEKYKHYILPRIPNHILDSLQFMKISGKIVIKGWSNGISRQIASSSEEFENEKLRVIRSLEGSLVVEWSEERKRIEFEERQRKKKLRNEVNKARVFEPGLIQLSLGVGFQSSKVEEQVLRTFFQSGFGGIKNYSTYWFTQRSTKYPRVQSRSSSVGQIQIGVRPFKNLQVAASYSGVYKLGIRGIDGDWQKVKYDVYSAVLKYQIPKNRWQFGFGLGTTVNNIIVEGEVVGENRTFIVDGQLLQGGTREYMQSEKIMGMLLETRVDYHLGGGFTLFTQFDINKILNTFNIEQREAYSLDNEPRFLVAQNLNFNNTVWSFGISTQFFQQNNLLIKRK